MRTRWPSPHRGAGGESPLIRPPPTPTPPHPPLQVSTMVIYRGLSERSDRRTIPLPFGQRGGLLLDGAANQVDTPPLRHRSRTTAAPPPIASPHHRFHRAYCPPPSTTFQHLPPPATALHRLPPCHPATTCHHLRSGRLPLRHRRWHLPPQQRRAPRLLGSLLRRQPPVRPQPSDGNLFDHLPPPSNRARHRLTPPHTSPPPAAFYQVRPQPPDGERVRLQRLAGHRIRSRGHADTPRAPQAVRGGSRDTMSSPSTTV